MNTTAATPGTASAGSPAGSSVFSVDGLWKVFGPDKAAAKVPAPPTQACPPPNCASAPVAPLPSATSPSTSARARYSS